MPANAGDLGSIPGSGRSPGVGNGSPLWYSCLGNPMDRRALCSSPWDHKQWDTSEWLSTQWVEVRGAAEYDAKRRTTTPPPPMMGSLVPNVNHA